MNQRTLKKAISFSGKTLFSGAETTLTLEPAKSCHGIVFQRVDLPHQPIIPANLNEVLPMTRTTALGKENEEVHMVEHLLAALSVYQIDNLLIKINGSEIPSGDGSAAAYVGLIEKAGVVDQEAERKIFSLSAPVYYADKETTLMAIPCDHLQISFTLCYPNHPLLDAQFYSYSVDQNTFFKEIAPARTFALYEEVLQMQKMGLLQKTGLDQAVVIKDKEILNPEGLRFTNEMVRHKIQDLIGDISLIGKPFHAHIISVRSGHAAHIPFAKQIQNVLK